MRGSCPMEGGCYNRVKSLGPAPGIVHSLGPPLENFCGPIFRGNALSKLLVHNNGGLGCGNIFTSYGIQNHIQYSVCYMTTPYSINYSVKGAHLFRIKYQKGSK